MYYYNALLLISFISMMHSYNEEIENSTCADTISNNETPLWLEYGGIIIIIIVIIEMFWALAVVCEDYFVPALHILCEVLKIPDDVAGATFMAAGASSPEMFTSFLSLLVFHSNIGVGTVVGSEIFNHMIISAGSVLYAKHGVLQLNRWVIYRDTLAYMLSLLALIYTLKGTITTSLPDAFERSSWSQCLNITVFGASLLVILYFIYATICGYYSDIVEHFEEHSISVRSCYLLVKGLGHNCYSFFNSKDKRSSPVKKKKIKKKKYSKLVETSNAVRKNDKVEQTYAGYANGAASPSQLNAALLESASEEYNRHDVYSYDEVREGLEPYQQLDLTDGNCRRQQGEEQVVVAYEPPLSTVESTDFTQNVMSSAYRGKQNYSVGPGDASDIPVRRPMLFRVAPVALTDANNIPTYTSRSQLSLPGTPASEEKSSDNKVGSSSTVKPSATRPLNRREPSRRVSVPFPRIGTSTTQSRPPLTRSRSVRFSASQTSPRKDASPASISTVPPPYHGKFRRMGHIVKTLVQLQKEARNQQRTKVQHMLHNTAVLHHATTGVHELNKLHEEAQEAKREGGESSVSNEEPQIDGNTGIADVRKIIPSLKIDVSPSIELIGDDELLLPSAPTRGELQRSHSYLPAEIQTACQAAMSANDVLSETTYKISSGLTHLPVHLEAAAVPIKALLPRTDPDILGEPEWDPAVRHSYAIERIKLELFCQPYILADDSIASPVDMVTVQGSGYKDVESGVSKPNIVPMKFSITVTKQSEMVATHSWLWHFLHEITGSAAPTDLTTLRRSPTVVKCYLYMYVDILQLDSLLPFHVWQCRYFTLDPFGVSYVKYSDMEPVGPNVQLISLLHATGVVDVNHENLTFAIAFGASDIHSSGAKNKEDKVNKRDTESHPETNDTLSENEEIPSPIRFRAPSLEILNIVVEHLEKTIHGAKSKDIIRLHLWEDIMLGEEEPQKKHSTNILTFPDRRERFSYAWHILTYPVKCLFHYSLVDCQQEENKDKYLGVIALSVVYLGVLSYIMITCCDFIGLYLGVSPTIMGLTLSAIGTSFPNLWSSLVVAKQGYGNMAICNALGSNIFNINIALGLPWLFYIAIEREGKPYDEMRDNGIVFFVVVLEVVCAKWFIMIALNHFRMHSWMAGIYVTIYIVVMIMVLALS